MSEGIITENGSKLLFLGILIGLVVGILITVHMHECNNEEVEEGADSETWKCVEYAKQTILNPDWFDACCVGDQGKFCVDEPDNPDDAPSNIEQMEIDNETVNYTECRNTDRLVARNITSICLTKTRK